MKVQLYTDYDYDNDKNPRLDQPPKQDQPEKVQIEFPDYTVTDIGAGKREVNYDYLHSKEKFKEGFQNFWESSPYTYEHGYKYLAPPPGTGAQDANYQQEVPQQTKYEEYDLKPKHHNSVRSLESPKAFINSHSLNVDESPPSVLDIHGISTADATPDNSDVHHHLLEYYKRKFASDAAAKQPAFRRTNENINFKFVVPEKHRLSLKRLDKIIQRGKDNYYKFENLRNPAPNDYQYEDPVQPEIVPTPKIEEVKQEFKTGNDRESQVEKENVDVKKEVENVENITPPQNFQDYHKGKLVKFKEIEKSIDDEIKSNLKQNDKKYEIIKEQLLQKQQDRDVVEKKLSAPNKPSPIKIEDVEEKENFDYEMLPHLQEENKRSEKLEEKVEAVKDEIHFKKEQPEKTKEADPELVPLLDEHDKQFENVRQEFLNRQTDYAGYNPEAQSSNKGSEVGLLTFQDVDGNIYHDAVLPQEKDYENEEKNEEESLQSEDDDGAKKELEQRVIDDHYSNYNRDDKDRFRIYFDYSDENTELSEKKLPFYTGDIEGFVKHEFEKDKESLKEKTEKNLEDYYRSIEEGEGEESENQEEEPEGEAEEEESPENEEQETEPEDEEPEKEEQNEEAAKEDEPKKEGFTVTQFSEQTQAQAAPNLYDNIDHAKAFLSIPTYFGGHQQASSEFDQNFDKNFPAKQSQAATTNSEVVQPLHSGIISAGALQELQNSNKPLTIPFDFDYSASEIKERKSKVVVDMEASASEHTGYENYYVPERYTEEFTYTVPEPAPINYAQLEAKDFEDDDTLSKNAKIYNKESGRKHAILTVNGNTYHL
jgi:hypothetical protein